MMLYAGQFLLLYLSTYANSNSPVDELRPNSPTIQQGEYAKERKRTILTLSSNNGSSEKVDNPDYNIKVDEQHDRDADNKAHLEIVEAAGFSTSIDDDDLYTDKATRYYGDDSYADKAARYYGDDEFHFGRLIFNATFSKLGKKMNASGLVMPLNNCHKLQDWAKVREVANWVGLYTSSKLPNKNPCSHPIINAMVAIDNGATAVIFDAFDDLTNTKYLLKRDVESTIDKSIVVIESLQFRRIISERPVGRSPIRYFVNIVDSKIESDTRPTQHEVKASGRSGYAEAQKNLHLKWLIAGTAFIVVVSFTFLVILVTLKRYGDRCKLIYWRLKMKTISNKNLSDCDAEQIMNDNLEEQCSICLQDFQIEEIVRTLPCNHTFHQHCINRWLFYRKSCPLCIYTIKGVKTVSASKCKSQKRNRNFHILTYISNKKHARPGYAAKSSSSQSGPEVNLCDSLSSNFNDSSNIAPLLRNSDCPRAKRCII